tara:strand:+ start:632 stop:1024 length:393 start_codon:yes stop_codon:yes gene_type:complete
LTNKIKNILNLKIVKFGISGVLSLFIELLAFKFLSYVTSFVLAHAISFLFSAIFNFILSRSYVFVDSTNPIIKQIFYFTLIVILTGVTNTSVFIFLVDIGFNAFESKFGSILISIIFNFFAKKYFAFKEM